MRIFLTGGSGLLGRTLVRHLRAHDVLAPASQDADITDAQAIAEAVAAARPDVVIHCAAMTAVDRCEEERGRAFAVNAAGAANVADAARCANARLVALSTDYVFAGDAAGPYREDAPCAPATVYGQSKRRGEEEVRSRCEDHVIARVGWLYGPGGPSFVHRMMVLGREDGAPVRVVEDQVGNPTSTDAVARALLWLLDRPLRGTFHVTCEGEASWLSLAHAVFAINGFRRLIEPCTTLEMNRRAPRPRSSRLDKAALRCAGFPGMPDWRDALDQFFTEHPNG